jgi:SAM-dependent MidA family methyltransferase
MNELAEVIRREIIERGAISFARFMEMALYYPDLGYYERASNQVGREGDFYTSVSVGRLLGELLAFQFAEWLDPLNHASSTASTGSGFQIVEAGAHDGRLAHDILSWLGGHRPGLFEKLEYWIMEPSMQRREWQRKTLDEFNARVRWFASWEALTTFCPRLGTMHGPWHGARTALSANSEVEVRADKAVRAPGDDSRKEVTTGVVNGVIFANELLDAFPVHRIGWDAGRKTWFEWNVGWSGGEFSWVMAERSRFHSDPQIRPTWPATELPWPRLPDELLAVLPHQFTTEVSPSAAAWWSQAARALRRGRLLTLDYGLTAEQFFTPERAGGTLRAYQRHRQDGDILSNPGEQDLTSQVNFSALQEVGESAGLKTEKFISQTEFLTRIIEQTQRPKALFGAWTSKQAGQFQILTHPDHLGRAFRVLIQSRSEH